MLIVCLISPLLILGLDLINNAEWFVNKLGIQDPMATSIKNLSGLLFNGFKMGIEILIINGFLTFIGLWLISSKDK